MLAEGVQVRIGAGEQGHITSLTKYFDERWIKCVEMWAMYERKNLPLGDKNTTNRIERSFRSMKDELLNYNLGDVSTARAVTQLVEWAENNIEERYAAAHRHRMQIFDADPIVQDLYTEASLELTDTGCIAFKRSMDKPLHLNPS